MDDDTENYTSIVQTAKIVFGVILFIGTCIQMYVIHDGTKKKHKNTNLTWYNICIGIGLLILMFISCARASKIDMICGNVNTSLVIQAVLYPFIFVYLLGMATINLFPIKKKCFSVLFGNVIIGSFFGFKDVLQELITLHRNNSTSGTTESSLTNINFILQHEPHVLFNELTSKHEYLQSEDNSEHVLSWDSFDVINNELKNITRSNLNSNPNFEELKRYILFSVLIRDLVGESVWIIGLGLITIQLGFNFLLSQNCSSLKQSQDDFEQYVEEKLK